MKKPLPNPLPKRAFPQPFPKGTGDGALLQIFLEGKGREPFFNTPFSTPSC